MSVCSWYIRKCVLRKLFCKACFKIIFAGISGFPVTGLLVGNKRRMSTLPSLQMREHGWNVMGPSWHQRLPAHWCYCKRSPANHTKTPRCCKLRYTLLIWNSLCDLPSSFIPQKSCPLPCGFSVFLVLSHAKGFLNGSRSPSATSSSAAIVYYSVLLSMPRFCLPFRSRLLPVAFLFFFFF